MPILGILASSYLAAAGDYESIATVTVGSGGASTITFSSIPSTYTHLQIRGIGRVTIDSNLRVKLGNGSIDTGNNYSWHQVYGTGSVAGASSGSNASSMLFTSLGDRSNIFSATVIDILDYANTNKYKTLRALDGWDANGEGVVDLASGSWRSTSAVNVIELTNAGNFSQYTTFALYGIKAA